MYCPQPAPLRMAASRARGWSAALPARRLAYAGRSGAGQGACGMVTSVVVSGLPPARFDPSFSPICAGRPAVTVAGELRAAAAHDAASLVPEPVPLLYDRGGKIPCSAMMKVSDST